MSNNKGVESLQKDVIRLRKKCIEFQRGLENKKEALRQFSALIKKLLSENRITKEEIGEFLKKKKKL
jgi:3-oxoacyl-[acyl-carrier-protein] synthase III